MRARQQRRVRKVKSPNNKRGENEGELAVKIRTCKGTRIFGFSIDSFTHAKHARNTRW